MPESHDYDPKHDLIVAAVTLIAVVVVTRVMQRVMIRQLIKQTPTIES